MKPEDQKWPALYCECQLLWCPLQNDRQSVAIKSSRPIVNALLICNKCTSSGHWLGGGVWDDLRVDLMVILLTSW